MRLDILKQTAAALGFDACGAARVRALPDEARRLGGWLRAGCHAGMGYLEKYADLRQDPAALVEGARTVVVCLIGYKSGREYPAGIPQIASYARFADYHRTIKPMLAALLDHFGGEGRAFVDTGPVLEKRWAVEAGLGWQGRHSLLIHPRLGSRCLIGTIVTPVELDGYDRPFAENRCGNCRRCVERCPTGAIRADGTIDCRRCLSYQTIENRGPIPEELLPALGERLFGCDTCQQACLWNESAPQAAHPLFQADEGLFSITREAWLAMGSGEFRRRFGHTPLARAGLKKLKTTLSPDIHLHLQPDAESTLHRADHPIGQREDLPAGGPAIIDEHKRLTVVDTGGPVAEPFQPGAVDEPAGG